MSTCKDCIHYDVCKALSGFTDKLIKSYEKVFEKYGDAKEECEYFKDKSKLIELPCKIGDYIKWRNNWGGTVLLEVTGFDFDVKGNVIKYHTKYSDIQPFIDDENVINIIPKERLSQERGKLND